jgi:paired amphipathic helix protein Sin3a
MCLALKMDTKKGYYNVLLALIDKLFEGNIDQQTFEESVRYIFGTDAYILFTIDKLVLSLVRHVNYTKNHIYLSSYLLYRFTLLLRIPVHKNYMKYLRQSIELSK